MQQEQQAPLPNTKDQKENLFWIDLLRFLAMFGVVIIHNSADVVTEWDRYRGSWWWAANLYDSLARASVPLFIMLSGALLLPKRENYGVFFSKRFRRVLIPFLAWSVLYLLWKKHFYNPEITMADAVKMVINDRVHYHFWFVYMILGLYLITPVFRVLVAAASRRDLFYFSCLWFFIASFFPLAEKFESLYSSGKLKFMIPVEPAQGFIGYFVLGYLLRISDTRRLVLPALLVSAASLSVTFFGTYLASSHVGSLDQTLYANMAPNVVLYTVSLFILVKHGGVLLESRLSPAARQFIFLLSKTTFGVYLIHPMVIDALNAGRWGFVVRGDVPHPLVMIPVTCFAVYTFSFAAIYLIQKIPYLREIT